MDTHWPAELPITAEDLVSRVFDSVIPNVPVSADKNNLIQIFWYVSYLHQGLETTLYYLKERAINLPNSDLLEEEFFKHCNYRI